MSYWDICVILTYPNGIYNNIDVNYEVNSMSIDYISIGNRIKELRIKRGYTQQSLGEKINKSKATISSYEKDVQLPPLEVAIDIASALNRSLTDRVQEAMELNR